MLQRLPLMLAALWWGGISALSFLAVPLLFAQLGSPAVAGPVAAKIFSLQCWAGIVIGGLLLVLLKRGEPTPEAFTTLGLVCLALLLALLQEFGVAQKIVTARASGGNLRLWHAVGSLMMLGQWLCTAAVLWRLGAGPRSTQPG